MTIWFRDLPKKARKVTKATQGAKQKGRARKVTEIADDPIEEEEDWGHLGAGDDVPVAGPSTARNPRQLQPPPAVINLEDDDETNGVEADDDDVIDISDSYSSRTTLQPRMPEDVFKKCYEDLKARVKKVGFFQNILSHHLHAANIACNTTGNCH